MKVNEVKPGQFFKIPSAPGAWADVIWVRKEDYNPKEVEYYCDEGDEMHCPEEDLPEEDDFPYELLAEKEGSPAWHVFAKDSDGYYLRWQEMPELELKADLEVHVVRVNIAVA